MRKILCMLMVSVVSVLLCGCNSEVPDLTPEQTALISEYATLLLVKHSELSDRNLLNDAELEAGIIAEAEERERRIKADEIAQTYLNNEVEMVDSTVIDEEQENRELLSEMNSSQSIAEFWGEDGFAIDYNSYELCESYPATGADEVYMAMDATQGKQLCVIKFTVQNVKTEDCEFDMIGKRGNYFLRMGDGNNVYAQATMLLDDLSSYKGTIAGNTSEQLVLVFEVDDTITQMDAVQLVMANGSDEKIISLQ